MFLGFALINKIMAHIVLVACARTKRLTPSPAKDLYTSPLFMKSRAVAEGYSGNWYILSAKHGVLRPDEVVHPYDQTLLSMKKGERNAWAVRVYDVLRQVSQPTDTITFLAGCHYREDLQQLLEKAGYTINVPMLGLSIGRQLQWLNSQLLNVQVRRDLNEFYRLLNRLEQGLRGKVLLKNCSGRMPWPKKGVYFFFENGECRKGSQDLRVVRVGTHAVSEGSSSTLWNRLRTHKGTKEGGGNHRGSIFRLHIGLALHRKTGDCFDAPLWGVGQSASDEVRRSEKHAEAQVSAYIGDMSLLWISVSDVAGPASDRAYIERNSIALLSCQEKPVDPPRDDWLGCYSPYSSVKNSGLWNVRHSKDVYDPRFLGLLADYIDFTLGDSPQPVPRCSRKINSKSSQANTRDKSQLQRNAQLNLPME